MIDGIDFVTLAAGLRAYKSIFNGKAYSDIDLQDHNLDDVASIDGGGDAINIDDDLKTDRWLNTTTNTFLGIGVCGAGLLEHTAGTEGYDNVGIGFLVFHDITKGYRNVGVGVWTMDKLTTGNYNMALGYASMHLLQDGHHNVGVGAGALYTLVSSYYNVAIGWNALNLATGNANIGIGNRAGDNVTTGNNNIIVGHDVDADSATGSNQLNIGGTIKGDLSTGQIWLGDKTGGNYFETLGDGEVRLHGTAKVIRHIIVDPKRFKLPAANYPSESFEGLFYTLDFDAATEESAYCIEHVPYRWDTSVDIEVEIHWLHDTADAGVVVWGIEYKAIKAGETVAGAGTTITKASAGTHTENVLVSTLFTSKILAANLEAHDMLAIRFFRKAADDADTLAEDAKVINVCFHFTQNKLGKAS